MCCGAGDLNEILDLGMHPMADTFVPVEKLDSADKAYPLVCDLCPTCCQIQLRTVTEPDERYVDADYSYTSSNSSTSRNHWIDYAKEVTDLCRVPAGAIVVEIGSNDGFLLGQFQSLGFVAEGVEPSPVMASLARGLGYSVTNDYFTSSSADGLVPKWAKKPALIVANNVFNHSNDPLDFARGVKNLLADDGTFVFELPYWLCSIEQGKFDQVYHEHVSYFTVTYAINLMAKVGLHVSRVDLVDYHGGSIRVFVRHRPEEQPHPSVATFVAKEESAGLFSLESYRHFNARIRSERNHFLARLYSLKAAGATIVCVGAAAKGNTFLNFYNLDASVVDFVTDASETKIGKYTPSTRIQIQEDSVIGNLENLYVIILSWNLASLLEPKLRTINSKLTLLNPYKNETS
jgi:SAM-dependent methyltransferase